MVQLLHIHVVEILHSAPVLEAAAAAVAAVAVREDRGRHMDWLVYVVVDCCGACSCLGGHNYRQQAEVHRVRLAFHQAQLQRVHHSEWHRRMLPVHRSALLAVQRVSGPRNM